jgi:ribosome-binding ATPase YchF (GTP1/OBG family)
VDPARDLARVEEELVLSDHVLVETRLERIDKLERVGKKPESANEKVLLTRLRGVLEEGEAIRSAGLSLEEEKSIRGYGFLSHKPLLAVWNAGEGESVTLPADRTGFTSVSIHGRTELDLLPLPEDERAAFRSELGVAEPGVEAFLRAAHRLLGLLTFFTAGPPEVKAWQVPLGSNAVDAAGKIHSDIARGFIRCEVVTAEDLLETRAWGQAREKGRMRTEGREYRVQDGDCLHVLFKN